MGTSMFAPRTRPNSFGVLFAVFLVCSSSVSARTVFYPRTEYKYEYIGQVSAGIPSINNEVTGLGLRCYVTILGDNNFITVQLDDVRAFSGVTVDGKSSKEVPMQYQPQNLKELKYPFKITYDGDRLNNVEVTNEDTYESVNIKKALAVLLTINLDKHAQTRQVLRGGPYNVAMDNHQNQQQPFQVVEDGVEGKCISRYTYERLPWVGNPWSQVLNVTRKRDTDNCLESATLKMSINEPKKCIGCEAESLDFINYGVTTQYNLKDEAGELILELAEAFGRGVYTPLPPNGDSIKAKQYQKLTLLQVQKSSRSSSFTGRGKQYPTLGIVPEEVELKARYRRDTPYTKSARKTQPEGVKTFDFVKTSDRLRKSNPIVKAQTILDQTASDCLNLYNCTMEYGLLQVTRLVDELRQVDFVDLERFFTTNQNNEQKRPLVIDSLAMTGTDVSTLLIKKLIEERKLTGETAVQIVSTLPAYTLDPQPPVLDELWALCKNPLLRENRQLLVTALAAFGKMANQACSPKESSKTVRPYHVKQTGCPSTLITRHLQELFIMYDDSMEPWQRTAVMFAISRMGLNQTLDYIAPYLRSKMFALPVGHRIEILMTMYEFGPSRQAEVVELVLPIFYNKTLTAEERILAFDVLSYITTSQELTNELALYTWEEPSDQVAAYIYDYLKAVSKLKTPCWKALAMRLEKALPLAKPVKSGLLSSGYRVHHTESEKWGLHSLLGYGTYGSSSSLTPRVTHMNLMHEAGGYYYNLLEMTTIHEGLQHVLDNLIGPKADFTGQRLLSDIFRPDPEDEQRNTYDNGDGVKISTRGDQPFYSRIMITYLQDRNRIFFLDDHTLEDIKSLGILPHNKDLSSSLRDGIPINYRKHLLVLDNQLKFSSIIGTPLTIVAKMPAIVDVKGQISSTATKTGITNALSTIIVKPEITATLGMSMLIGLRIENIFDGTINVAGAASKFYVTLPFNAQITLDLIRQNVNLVLKKPQGSGTQRPPYTSYGVYSTSSNPSLQWKVQPMLAILRPETGHIDAHHLRSNPIKLTDRRPGALGTWVVEEDKRKPDTSDRYKDITGRSTLDQLNFWWAPHHFNNLNVAYEESVLLDSEIEANINWKRTPSPYEAEVWKGKSSLQQMRPWNYVPEWRNILLVTCATYNPNSRLESSDSASKKSWFGRFKDKVSSLGRSGGTDDYEENLEQADQAKTVDTEQEAEDKGRGLHPHHKESGSDLTAGVYAGHSTTSSQGVYRASYSGQESHGSQIPNYGGQGGSQYGSSSSGSSTQYGSSSGQVGISQSHVGGIYGGDDFSQTTDDLGQKNYNAEDDFSQKTFTKEGGLGQLEHGQLGPRQYEPGQYGPGQTSPGQQGPGQYGGSYPSRVAKKSIVRKLKITDEGSQTLISIQVTTKHPIKDRRINMEITILDNAVQAVKKVHANVDFNQHDKRENKKIRHEVCYNGYFFQGHSGCPQKESTMPAFDMKLSWGEPKCDDAKRFISLKGSYGVRDEDKDLWNKYQRDCPQEAGIGVHTTKECSKAYRKATTLTKGHYELRYTESEFNLFVDSLISSRLRCSPSVALTDQNLQRKTDDGLITVDTEYDMYGKTISMAIQRPHGSMKFEGVPYESFAGLFGPRSSEVSSVRRWGNMLTNGHFSTSCLVTPESIRTFSGMNYNYTLRTCQHVVAKDCSASRLFTVVASDNKISIEIYGHRIESTYGGSSTDHRGNQHQRPQLMIDGKMEEFGRENEFGVIRSEGDDDVFVAMVSANGPYVTVKSPPMGISVTFSRTTVQVELSQFWRGKVCGICGEDTKDIHATFLGPDKCLYGEPEYFARSYQIRDGQCGTSVNAFQDKSSRCKPHSQTGVPWSPGYQPSGGSTTFTDSRRGLSGTDGYGSGRFDGTGSLPGSYPTQPPYDTRFPETIGRGNIPVPGSYPTQPPYSSSRISETVGKGGISGSYPASGFGSSSRFGESGSISESSTDYGAGHHGETKTYGSSSITTGHKVETYSGTDQISGSSLTDLGPGRLTGAGSGSKGYLTQTFPSGSSGTYSSTTYSSGYRQMSSGTLPISGAGTYGATGHKDYNANEEQPMTAQKAHTLGLSDDGGCYVRRNQMKRQTLSTTVNYSPVTQTKKVCFSTDAIRQCRASCIGLDFLPVNVKFRCYQESSAMAVQLLAVVQDQPLNYMTQDGTVDFEEEMLIAQKCLPKY